MESQITAEIKRWGEWHWQNHDKDRVALGFGKLGLEFVHQMA